MVSGVWRTCRDVMSGFAADEDGVEGEEEEMW